jgi:hypothetical protein
MSRSFSWSPRNIGAKLSFRSRFDNRLNDYIVPSIIGANVLVFSAWQMSDRSLNRWLSNNFTVTPHRIVEFHTSLHTLVTSFFSHRDIFHLLANMITLYAFCCIPWCLKIFNFVCIWRNCIEFIVLLMAILIANFKWLEVAAARSKFRQVGIHGNIKNARSHYSILSSFYCFRYETALGASGAISAVVMWRWVVTCMRSQQRWSYNDTMISWYTI